MNIIMNDDLPKKDPSEDLLGYANFAKFVADNIILHHFDTGLVISLDAPWGYGKTTCLRFIEYHLKDKPNIEILHFNPWSLSDNKDRIILEFLHALGTKLRNIIHETESNKKIPWNEKIAYKLKLKFHKRNEANEFNAIWKGIVGMFSNTYVEQEEKNYDDLHNQKRQIEKMLHTQQKRIVVFIDDIDRLTKDEIRNIFRLIKAIADFDFITYVIAFDQHIVVDALDKDFCTNGFDYLKKIVQIPLKLPRIDPENINNILFSCLDNLIRSVRYDIISEKVSERRERFFEYNKGLIQPNIKNIRDINRLFNGLFCNYSQIAEDVDLLDFFALEIIRLFKPILYQEINNNLPFFVGDTPFLSNNEKMDYFRLFAENHSLDLNIIKTMFPQTNQFLGGSTYSSNWQERWDQEKRICSNERSNIYFGLRLKEGQVSDVELNNFLDSLNSQGYLDKNLHVWSKEKLSSGRTKLFFWIPKLTSSAAYITNKKLESFFIGSIFKFRNSFNDIGDTDNSHLFTIDNDLRLVWLYNAILQNIKDEQYIFNILKKAISNSNNLSAIAEFVLRYGIPHGFFPDIKDQTDEVVTKQHYLQLEKILINKIAKNFTNIHTYNTPFRLLQFMQVRANRYYIKAMKHYMETDEDLITLLEHLYVNISSSEKGVFKSISTWPFNAYISDEDLMQKLRGIKSKKLAARAQKIIDNLTKAKELRNR